AQGPAEPRTHVPRPDQTDDLHPGNLPRLAPKPSRRETRHELGSGQAGARSRGSADGATGHRDIPHAGRGTALRPYGRTASLAVLILGPVLLPEYRDPAAGRFDLLGSLPLLAAVLPIVYGINEQAVDGWHTRPVLAIVAGLVAGVAFGHRQRTCRFSSPTA